MPPTKNKSKKDRPMDIMSCINNASNYSSNTASALPLQLAATSNSPEPPEAFLPDLLHVVNDDTPMCTSCEEGIQASSRCRDCTELLCEPCVRAHQRVRITKDHRISRLHSTVNQMPNGNTTGSLGSSSQASNSPCSSGMGTSPANFCDIHHEPHRVYCETCTLPSCTECTLMDHRGHQLVYIQDAIDAARSVAHRLCAETRSAVSAVREAIDNVQRVSEGVEVRSHQAAVDIRAIVKRFMTALEEREKELICRIEHQRQAKGNVLLAQMDNLRLALSKLARTSELINETMESSNGLDLIVVNEKASSDLKQLRVIRNNLVPCEDDHIIFIPPDQNLLRAISSMGNISIHNHMFRPRLMPPVEMKISEGLGPIAQPMIRHSRGRPIYGANHVVVRESNGAPILTFGAEGEDEGLLCRPWGVCCDKRGNIIVADRSNNRVQIFNPNGIYLKHFGSQGTGPGQFDRPAGICIDPNNRLIVADKDNHRIQIFTIDGTFVLMFGEKGCRNGQFNYPWDVACNAQSQICVTDTRNHRIQLFNPDGSFINKYGFEGSATMWKHFDSPRGVCFNPYGDVIVTDFNNHRLVIIDPNFTKAQFLGQEGSGFKQFLRPQGIVCDDEGRIIVADSRNSRIEVFESSGTFMWKIGQPGKGVGEMDRPSGICITPEGRIVVVDFGNNRVQIF